MKAEAACIYNSIRPYLKDIPIVEFKKGQQMVTSSDDLKEVFFILEGTALVECATKSGRSLLVDVVPENEFVGKISYIYEKNLRCDVYARNKLRAFKFRRDIFEQLRKDPEFNELFHRKSSMRLYEIYKARMTRELFSCREIIAACILEHQKEGLCVLKPIREVCLFHSISRKSRYNVIEALAGEGIIQKTGSSITLLDRERLMDMSQELRAFL